MGAGSVQQMAARVGELMEDRLGLRGRSLADRLARGGRALPRRVRAAAEVLAAAEAGATQPRLVARLDHARLAEAYDICIRHLRPLGAAERRRSFVLDVLTRVATAVVVTTALVITVLVWRGYV
ncbi:MAG: hypothetical protein N2422_10185 [Rhodobacteraceae bacterium]|nr:hypothetical protein [Paracoccaceae bacterium]